MKKNGYPLPTIKQLMKEIEESKKQKEVTQVSRTVQPNPQEQKVLLIPLHFASSRGTTIVKNLNKTLKNVLPSNVKARIRYTGQKLNSRFQIKDKINKNIKMILSIIQNALKHSVWKTI